MDKNKMKSEEAWAPNEIVIQLTNRCNLNCRFCYNRNEPKHDMSYDDVLRVIKQASDMKSHAVRFTGGEPVLRDDLQALVNFAKDLGLYTIVNTNGTIEKGISCDRILVSFHDLARLDEVTRFSDKNMNIMLATIATLENTSKLDEFYQVFKGLHTKGSIIEWFILRPIPPEKITLVQLEELRNKINSLNQEHDMNAFIANAVPLCAVSNLSGLCAGGYHDSGYSRLYVGANGDIESDYLSRTILGNINATTLDEAWNSPYMQKLRAYEFLGKACRICPVLDKCKGSLIVDGEQFDIDLINPANL